MAAEFRGARRGLVVLAMIIAGITGPSVVDAGSAADASAPVGCYASRGVSGYVTDQDGAPVAGAPVLLVARREPARMRVGQRISSRTLGFTHTDTSGCYAMPLVADPALLASADSHGVVSMSLTIQVGHTMQTVDLQRSLPVRGGRVVPGAAHVIGAVHQSFGPQADAARASAAYAAVEAPVMRAGGMVARLPEDTAGATPEVVPAPRGVTLSSDDGQTEAVVKIFAKRPVLVGQWWSQMKGVSETWQYSRGATSMLGVAASTTGQPDSFTTGMTVAHSTSATVGWPTAHGKTGTFYLTYFRYAKYLVSYCDGTIGCQPWEWLVKPYSWEHGATSRRHIPAPAVKRANCTFYKKGSWEETAGSQAVTWTNGVTIGGDLLRTLGLNVTLSSETGFTVQAENHVLFTDRGYLCGTMGPLSNPGAVLARSSLPPLRRPAA